MHPPFRLAQALIATAAATVAPGVAAQRRFDQGLHLLHPVRRFSD